MKARINERNAQRRGILRLWISGPFIYGMVIPLFFLDVCMSIYQAICFPLYGIEKVDRRKFFRGKRGRLHYLNWNEKLNCWYCEYANGVLSYGHAIQKQTEKMWCPIKAAPGSFNPPHRKNFAEYGNEKALVEELKKSTHVKERK